MTARHTVPRKAHPGPTWEVVVACVVCTGLGMLVVASVRPPYIDRTQYVYTPAPTITVTRTVTATPTPTPAPIKTPTPTKKATTR